jgi:hypothetical protein
MGALSKMFISLALCTLLSSIDATPIKVGAKHALTTAAILSIGASSTKSFSPLAIARNRHSISSTPNNLPYPRLKTSLSAKTNKKNEDVSAKICKVVEEAGTALYTITALGCLCALIPVVLAPVGAIGLCERVKKVCDKTAECQHRSDFEGDRSSKAVAKEPEKETEQKLGPVGSVVKPYEWQ